MTATATPSPALSPARRWITHRPLTAFAVLVTAGGWPLMAVPALTAHGVLPGGPLPAEPFVLATLLLVMLPAALGVTAVVDGRAGVRALLARAFRWRFPAGWWVAVLAGLPVATVAVGLASGRRLETGDLGGVLLGALVSTVGALVVVNLWEETVWAGFLQVRVQERHGFWPAALLTAVAFAGLHVPLQLTGTVTVASVATSVGLLLVLGLLTRVLAGVVLAGTGGSVLAVGVVHALFNAVTDEDDLAAGLLSGGSPLLPAVAATALVTALGGLALRARARRRASVPERCGPLPL
ncbi:CPBP family intramembrane glutamic endopeptidase [Blastococcus sp. SYSU D00820]